MSVENVATFTDAELAALALAADPATPVDPDAIPLDVFLQNTPGLLPEWYMPPVRARQPSRAGQIIALLVVSAFLLIEAAGLCATYGQPPLH
jgi:hypothetical protein